jgi:integrase
LRVFLDDRAESGTRDGQLRQAAEAVTGYCGPFRVPQNTPVCGPGDAGTGVVEPAEALAHMQRLVQLRHYLPRTERSYLGWARLTGVSPQLRTKDIDSDRGTVSVRSGKGDTDRVTFLPRRSMDDLRAHLGEVRVQHDHDLHPRAPARSLLDRQPAAYRLDELLLPGLYWGHSEHA